MIGARTPRTSACPIAERARESVSVSDRQRGPALRVLRAVGSTVADRVPGFRPLEMHDACSKRRHRLRNGEPRAHLTAVQEDPRPHHRHRVLGEPHCARTVEYVNHDAIRWFEALEGDLEPTPLFVHRFRTLVSGVQVCVTPHPAKRLHGCP